MMNMMKSGLAVLLLTSLSTVSARCYDNRFIPFYPNNGITTQEKRSFFKVDGFFVTAHESYGTEVKKKQGVPEVWGTFDQRVVTDASVAAGNSNRLRPAWQLVDIPWKVQGKLQGQGFGISAEWNFFRNWSVGISSGFMHVSSNQKFVLPRDTARDLALTASDEEELDRNRRDTLIDLGFDSEKWADSGITDSKVYFHWTVMDSYVKKFRRAAVGFSFGALIPSAQKRDDANPAAISLGGQHIPGLCAGLDTNLEIREDLWFTLLFDISKRFTRTQTRRIPLKGEPEIFGATTGKIEVDPGVTLLVQPKLTFEDIQGGFGASLAYNFVYHARDTWQDKRDDTSLTIDISKISEQSKWRSEYVLFNLFYDFARVHPEKRFVPKLGLSWDIPIDLFGPLQVVKTQRVGLSVELVF